MLMFSFINAKGLPAVFRAGSNAARHEFDCFHKVQAGDYCSICQVRMLPHIREYTVNFFFDRPSKAIESVGLVGGDFNAPAPQAFVDFAMAFMSSPIRSRFFVTTLYQHWAGIHEEFEEDVHALVGSYIINAVPASSPDISVDEAVDTWLKEFFGPLLREIQWHEGNFMVGDEKFEIVNMTDAQTEPLWGDDY
jgi:hypothetical protein